MTSYCSTALTLTLRGAAAVVHHLEDLRTFLGNSFLSHSNMKIESVAADIGDDKLVALVCAVALIYLRVTGLYWIIERSNLPEKCDPGNSVMADKGFSVQDLFAPHDVQVNIPAFFTKKNRLTEKQILDGRKVSSKRVHIERLIGMGKTYKILVNGLNASETKLALHIISV